MQQVFGYTNEIFQQQLSTQEKHLRIVTYTIVPTSQTSGVLEWVENTLPFGDYLNDRTSKKGSIGSHSRYYPGEWGSTLCREHLKKASTAEEKLRHLEEIYRFHSPSFRFFFVERYGHSVAEWYQAKATYTRSVAVSSIVGHCLGIGDR